uniref:CULLIN_2 domain-containing protein n=1 Tax=Macrostomum lignano TaxID=282301 RepID=A0A1I8GLY0_9PLAT
RYSLLEFSVHRPPPPPPPPPTLPISSTKSSTAEDLPKSKPAAGDGNNGKARRNADSLNPDEASLIGALDMWASRFAFNGWNAFSANLLSQAVVEFLTDSRDGANNSADESGGVTVLRTGLNQFWSGVIERIVSDRRSKLSVPYLRSVFTALEQLRTVASEIALEPSLETSLKNIALVTSWTEASFDKHCRRVGIFRDFKRDYLTALLRCHREPLELRPSHVAAITEKHVAAYHSIRRLLDALFHCRDWFAFVSSGGGGYEALVRRAPRDALSCQLVCTALMEALFWYRLRLHLGQPGELYRFSQAEAGLRADGLRRFAKAIGCKVLMRGDWLEPMFASSSSSSSRASSGPIDLLSMMQKHPSKRGAEEVPFEAAEKIVDFSVLKALRVPKRMQNPAEILRRVSPDSKEFKTEIERQLRASFLSREQERQFRVQEAFMIENYALNEE